MNRFMIIASIELENFSLFCMLVIIFKLRTSRMTIVCAVPYTDRIMLIEF